MCAGTGAAAAAQVRAIRRTVDYDKVDARPFSRRAWYRLRESNRIKRSTLGHVLGKWNESTM